MKFVLILALLSPVTMLASEVITFKATGASDKLITMVLSEYKSTNCRSLLADKKKRLNKLETVGTDGLVLPMEVTESDNCHYELKIKKTKVHFSYNNIKSVKPVKIETETWIEEVSAAHQVTCKLDNESLDCYYEGKLYFDERRIIDITPTLVNN
jgi:hypothetical protein